MFSYRAIISNFRKLFCLEHVYNNPYLTDVRFKLKENLDAMSWPHFLLSLWRSFENDNVVHVHPIRILNLNLMLALLLWYFSTFCLWNIFKQQLQMLHIILIYSILNDCLICFHFYSTVILAVIHIEIKLQLARHSWSYQCIQLFI
jgi:hypothetical protein